MQNAGEETYDLTPELIVNSVFEMTRVTTDSGDLAEYNNNNNDKKRVFLGKFSIAQGEDIDGNKVSVGTYIDEAKKTPGNIVLNIDDWNKIAQELYTKRGGVGTPTEEQKSDIMWLYNEIFLIHWINQDCTFVLVTPLVPIVQGMVS